MLVGVSGWRQECELVALKFIDETMANFRQSLDSATMRIPKVELKDSPPMRQAADRDFVLNLYIDAAVGVAAMVAAQYGGGISSRLEDKVCEEFRRKFFELRKRMLGFEPEMERVEVKRPEDAN